MSEDFAKKKILEEVLSDQYGNLGISRIASFSHGKKISPNFFLLTGEQEKKWLVKIKDKEYNNQEQLENLYSILKKRKFSAIYPLKNNSRKYIARRHNLLVQVLPFMVEQRFDVDERKSDIIKLFSSFYNSLNSNAKFLESLDAEIFEKSKGKFERFVKEHGHLKKLREAFFDLDGLVKRMREYLRTIRNLKCCHWNCWEEN